MGQRKYTETHALDGVKKMITRKYLFTITQAHVDGTAPPEQYRMLWSVIGRILPIDVGKRVYRVDGVTQVENRQQRDARLGLKGDRS